MDTLLPCFKFKSLPISPSLHEIKKSHYGCLRLQGQNGQLGRLMCGKSGIVPELEDQIKLKEELIGVGNLKEKCRESNGIIELLECLEREAIMGDDEGKEANDYNRRAHIFDKSSRVFQAMKQRRSSKE